jgi:hypothetical protein
MNIFFALRHLEAKVWPGATSASVPYRRPGSSRLAQLFPIFHGM